MKKNFHIHILQIGNSIKDVFESVKLHLTTVFPSSYCTESFGNPEILREAYNPARKQYHSTTILRNVNELMKHVRTDEILTVVDVDLYVPRLNFVFGEAQCPGRFAIISTYRLKPEFYGVGNGELFVSRVKKEAVHELGHVLGLIHCINPQCVMYFSNSIFDTDYKGDQFCSTCNKKIIEVLGK